jgi:hypothetical protein
MGISISTLQATDKGNLNLPANDIWGHKHVSALKHKARNLPPGSVEQRSTQETPAVSISPIPLMSGLLILS